MEFLSVILFAVILYFIHSLKSSITRRLDKFDQDLNRIEATLKPREEMPVHSPILPAVEKEIIIKPVEQVQPLPEPMREKSLSEELAALLEKPAPAESKQFTPLQQPIEEENRFEPVSMQLPLSGPPDETLPPKKPTFLESNPDLEKFIGENLVSKIGIGILVLAIGFFVKYAIDNEWIGPIGRVGVGILCGGILAAVAHRLRNSYKAFSSVLVGGALAIFYFTITLAYHQFHLFSQTVAFIIMVVITAFAVVLSQLYNRQELAIIALIGGFATPFMVSEGSGNYKSLFSYLIILNSGLLVIAYNKAWRLLNVLAFVFTVVLFGSWLFLLPYDTLPATYLNGLLFATVFYVMFFIINVAHNIRENKKFIASDFGILLSNTCLYFAVGLYCLTAMNAGEYRGLFTASLGVLNLGASFLLLRNRKVDNNILYLLIGITLSFISLTAPIQLNGHNITLFWASEAVLLYWLFQKSKIRIIRLTSLIVWSAMLVSLVMDWYNVYGNNPASVPIILNKGFITTLFSALATYFLFFLRTKDSNYQGLVSSSQLSQKVFRITGILLLYASGALEINHQFNYYHPGTNLELLFLLLFTFAFVLSFLWIGSRIQTLYARWELKTGLLALCIIVYLLTIPATFEVQRQLLVDRGPRGFFLAHWLSAVLLAMIIYEFSRFLSQRKEIVTELKNVLTWAICVVIIIFLSAEVHLFVNSLFYSNSTSLPYIQQVYIKTGLPILWGLCSFGFMWQGMRLKFRTLRIVSLTLFLVILVKLFLFDIRNIPVAGKIAAFFCLGILLLVVSFMYQRLKKIIIEDEKKPVV